MLIVPCEWCNNAIARQKIIQNTLHTLLILQTHSSQMQSCRSGKHKFWLTNFLIFLGFATHLAKANNRTRLRCMSTSPNENLKIRQWYLVLLKFTVSYSVLKCWYYVVSLLRNMSSFHTFPSNSDYFCIPQNSWRTLQNTNPSNFKTRCNACQINLPIDVQWNVFK